MEKLLDKDFISKVESFIEKNNMITEGDHIVMGVSGGADSVALFVVLNSLKDKYRLSLDVVHVHHGLRKEADIEAEYVEKLCKSMNVAFHLFKYDVAKESKSLHLGTEETGRKLRYEAFESIAGKDGKIAIAHNLNDRSETMLFHLCRGTGPKGMAAIKAVSHNRIRPLLATTRNEIEEFLNKAQIEYFVDESNLENDYTRNKVRNIVFPLLEKEVNAESIKHIAKAAKLIEDQNDFITDISSKELNAATLKKHEGLICVSRSHINNLHISIKREVIKQMIDYMVPTNKDITLSHIESIIELLIREGNFEASLPYDIIAQIEYDLLTFSFDNSNNKEASYKDFGDIILDEGSYNIEALGRVEVKIFERDDDFILLQKEYTKYFDYDKIKCCLKLRKRANGDYLTINSSLGKKKLKDFFIDNKVPKNERDESLLVADGSHIVWIIGSRISEYYKVTEKTEKIVSIQVLKEDK